MLAVGRNVWRGTQALVYAGVILGGGVLAGGVLYAIGSELFGKDTILQMQSAAIERIKQDKVAQILGEGIKGDRRDRPSFKESIQNGNDVMDIVFNIHGSNSTGTVRCYLVKKEKWTFKRIAVEVPGHGLPSSRFLVAQRPEKLLELWFTSSADPRGLRIISDTEWQVILDAVKCKILSKVCNDKVDAYLLSESSLFVFTDKLILKTCGTTTLLHAIPLILHKAKSVGLLSVQKVFYSRKKWMDPERQLWPHRSWHSEVDYLDQTFNGGKAYMIGRTNCDHWCLYVAGCQQKSMLKTKDSALLVESGNDQTLEILMTELDDGVMEKFAFHNKTKLEASQGINSTGINALGPFHCKEAKVDEYAFDPCGYSLNGILDERYYTVHITPEKAYSYASVETNAVGDLDSINEFIQKVVTMFSPGKVTCTLFRSRAGPSGEHVNCIGTERFLSVGEKDYKRIERIEYGLAMDGAEEYDLVYLEYKQ